MLDMWNRDDVERILAALAAAGVPRGPEYIEALCHVALAFGLQLGVRRRTVAGILAVADDERGYLDVS